MVPAYPMVGVEGWSAGRGQRPGRRFLSRQEPVSSQASLARPGCCFKASAPCAMQLYAGCLEQRLPAKGEGVLCSGGFRGDGLLLEIDLAQSRETLQYCFCFEKLKLCNPGLASLPLRKLPLCATAAGSTKTMGPQAVLYLPTRNRSAHILINATVWIPSGIARGTSSQPGCQPPFARLSGTRPKAGNHPLLLGFRALLMS